MPMSSPYTLLFITPIPTCTKAVVDSTRLQPRHRRPYHVPANVRHRSPSKRFHSTTIAGTATAGGDAGGADAAGRSSERATLNEGDIVAVWRRSANKCDLARVTGGVSSGQTVDVIPLKPFVNELYVDANSGPTYESASDVRLVRSEYVPSQDGWIVLDVDLESASEYFALRPADLARAEVTVNPSVEKEETPQLSADAIQRQFFRPTRSQAYTAAALSVPLAGILYAAYGKARTVYEAAPGGDDLLHGEQFRALVQFAAAGGAILTLIVGSGLFLYALNAPASSTDEWHENVWDRHGRQLRENGQLDGGAEFHTL